jgi:hypothetical protein
MHEIGVIFPFFFGILKRLAIVQFIYNPKTFTI